MEETWTCSNPNCEEWNRNVRETCLFCNTSKYEISDSQIQAVPQDTTSPTSKIVETVTETVILPELEFVETTTPDISLEDTTSPTTKIIATETAILPKVRFVEATIPDISLEETTSPTTKIIETAPELECVETTIPDISPEDTTSPASKIVETATAILPKLRFVETTTKPKISIEIETPDQDLVQNDIEVNQSPIKKSPPPATSPHSEDNIVAMKQAFDVSEDSNTSTPPLAENPVAALANRKKVLGIYYDKIENLKAQMKTVDQLFQSNKVKLQKVKERLEAGK